MITGKPSSSSKGGGPMGILGILFGKK